MSYSVPQGYAVIVARAILMTWACTERIIGVPIDYELLKMRCYPFAFFLFKMNIKTAAADNKEKILSSPSVCIPCKSILLIRSLNLY